MLPNIFYLNETPPIKWSPSKKEIKKKKKTKKNNKQTNKTKQKTNKTKHKTHPNNKNNNKFKVVTNNVHASEKRAYITDFVQKKEEETKKKRKSLSGLLIVYKVILGVNFKRTINNKIVSRLV